MIHALLQILKNIELSISEDDQFEHYKYVLQALLPILKCLNEEQLIEKEIEAKRQGIYFQSLTKKLRISSMTQCLLISFDATILF